jgi:D-inositol-3-phosphate glycosyltransferase
VRVLFVLQYYHPYIGGLESMFQHLAEGLAARGHETRVVTTRLSGTPPVEEVGGVTIERVRVPRVADRYFFSALGLKAALRQAGWCDLVHTAPYNGVPPAHLAARRRRKPVVLTALEVLGSRWRSVEPSRLKAWSYRSFERMVTSLHYDRFVAISEATLRDCVSAGMDAAKGRVAYLGVDEIFQPGPRTGVLRSRLGIGDEDFLYLYFGRPGKTKGVDVLIAAAAQVQAQVPEAQLVLVLADQPPEWYSRLRRLAESSEARIHFVPSAPRELLPVYLRDADCVVVPSLTEGFGLTAAEACAVRVPVVATRAGSLPEVVSGRHLLVEPGSARALAEGIVRIRRGGWDETPRKRFSWAAMIDAYERIYSELVS